jgi:hypothetical protein
VYERRLSPDDGSGVLVGDISHKEVCLVSLSNGHHVRKLVAGACMVCAPLVLLVSTILHPEVGTGALSQATAIAESPDAWYLAHVLALVAIVLAVPAVLGFMHMLREKRVAEGLVGGALALLGLLAFIGLVAMELTFWKAGGPLVTAALIDRVSETTGIFVPFFVMTFGFGAGMLVLAYGLYAARAVSPLMAGCLAAGGALLAIAFPTATGWLMIVAAGVLALGFCSTGFMVLSEPDGEWEHTPEYHGIRSAAGAV